MQIKDLVVTGDARILGNLYTKEGNVSGGSGGSSGDSGVTYRLNKSGTTITLIGSDGSTSSVTDANTTYTLSSLGAAAASHTHTKSQITDFPSTMPPSSHTHDDRYYTESEVNNLLNGKANSSHTHGYIQDGTVGLKTSDSNEINFASNTNYIYFGYENRLNSSSLVTNYKFGTHSGTDGSTNGTIECGAVIESGTTLSNKYAAKSHSHSYLPLSGGTVTGAIILNGSNPHIGLQDTSNTVAYFQTYDDGSGLKAGFGYGWVNSFKLDQSGNATVSTQTPGSSVLRNSKLVTSDTNPSANGEINWTYK